MEGNGHPKTVEGLAYRLDHEGCLFCGTIRNEVSELRKDVDSLMGGVNKAIWVVVVAAVASGFSLLNTVISTWAAKP